MNRRQLLATLAAVTSMAPLRSTGQRADPVWRIGYFGGGIAPQASRLGIAVSSYDMRGAGDSTQMFDAAARWRAGAVLLLASAYLFSRQSEIMAFALKARLPALYPYPDLIRRGALATYGVNAVDLFRQAAGYVVKILNGAAPGELPIAQPTRFEFLVNLNAAKALGITIPQSVLVRADKVIR